MFARVVLTRATNKGNNRRAPPGPHGPWPPTKPSPSRPFRNTQTKHVLNGDGDNEPNSAHILRSTSAMKYIEFPELARLSQALTHEGPECSVLTRIEAYSCKNINRDKKLFRALEHAYNEEPAAFSPPSAFSALDREAEQTPFGPMDKHASRKTLYLLIATLNIAFPDHEFSDVRPAHFCKEESGAGVLNALSTTLVSTSSGSPSRSIHAPRTYSAYPPTSADFFPSSLPTSSSPLNNVLSRSPLARPQIVTGTHPTLYRILDEAIGLKDCEVYSYVPDVTSDPHATAYDDDEDEAVPDPDEDTPSESDEEAFAFDDYDIDEFRRSRPTRRQGLGAIDIPSRKSSGTESDGSPLRIRLRRRGALLWSSHWFFLNRKLKRIVFISVCARTKGGHQWTDEDDTLYSSSKLNSSEVFKGWEGATGAGARAMGIRIRGSA